MKRYHFVKHLWNVSHRSTSPTIAQYPALATPRKMGPDAMHNDGKHLSTLFQMKRIWFNDSFHSVLYLRVPRAHELNAFMETARHHCAHSSAKYFVIWIYSVNRFWLTTRDGAHSTAIVIVNINESWQRTCAWLLCFPCPGSTNTSNRLTLI